MEQQSSRSLEHVVSDWHGNHSPYLCCRALSLEGHPAVSERCCPSKSYPPVLQTASVTGADAMGAAGAQCCVVLGESLTTFTTAADYTTSTATMALKKG